MFFSQASYAPYIGSHSSKTDRKAFLEIPEKLPKKELLASLNLDTLSTSSFTQYPKMQEEFIDRLINRSLYRNADFQERERLINWLKKNKAAMVLSDRARQILESGLDASLSEEDIEFLGSQANPVFRLLLKKFGYKQSGEKPANTEITRFGSLISVLLRQMGNIPKLFGVIPKAVGLILVVSIAATQLAKSQIPNLYQQAITPKATITLYDDGGWNLMRTNLKIFNLNNGNLTGSVRAGYLRGNTDYSLIGASPYAGFQVDVRRTNALSRDLKTFKWAKMELSYAPLSLKGNETMHLLGEGLSSGYLLAYRRNKFDLAAGVKFRANFYKSLNSRPFYFFDQRESLFSGVHYNISERARIGLTYEGDYLLANADANSVRAKFHPQSQVILLEYRQRFGSSFLLTSPGIELRPLEAPSFNLNLGYGFSERMLLKTYTRIPLATDRAATVFDQDLEAGLVSVFRLGQAGELALNAGATLRDDYALDKFNMGFKISLTLNRNKRKEASQPYAVYAEQTFHYNLPDSNFTLAQYSDSVSINAPENLNFTLTIGEGQDTLIFTYELNFDDLYYQQQVDSLNALLASGAITNTEYRAGLYSLHFQIYNTANYTLPQNYAQFVSDMKEKLGHSRALLYVVSALANYMNKHNYNDAATEKFREYRKISRLSLEEIYQGILTSRQNPDLDHYVAVCAGIHELATDILTQCGVEAYSVALNTDDGVYHVVTMAQLDGEIYFVDYGNIPSYGTANPEYALMLFSSLKHKAINPGGFLVYQGTTVKHISTPDSRLILTALGIEADDIAAFWEDVKETQGNISPLLERILEPYKLSKKQKKYVRGKIKELNKKFQQQEVTLKEAENTIKQICGRLKANPNPAFTEATRQDMQNILKEIVKQELGNSLTLAGALFDITNQFLAKHPQYLNLFSAEEIAEAVKQAIDEALEIKAPVKEIDGTAYSESPFDLNSFKNRLPALYAA